MQPTKPEHAKGRTPVSSESAVQEQAGRKASAFGTPNTSLALVEGPAGMKPRTHNGLPIITRDEYSALYHGTSDETTIRTFNFQGYVEIPDGTLYYTDVIATNGLLGGIHVGIDGTRGYWDRSYGPMEGPEDILEYVAYIKISAPLQKEHGVVVECDSIHNAAKQTDSMGYTPEGLERAQNREDYIVIRLGFNPEEDAGARAKVLALAQAINDFILGSHPLEHLGNFIWGAEDILNDPVGSRVQWEQLRKKLEA